MRRPRPDRSIATAALAGFLALAGCSEEWGPEVIPHTTAEGVVLVSGRPADRGWVEILPIDGTLGDLTSARLKPDGSFRFDRAPVGEVAIRLVDVPLGASTPLWVFRNNSPIRRTTQSPPGPPMTIEMVEELIRYRKIMEGRQ